MIGSDTMNLDSLTLKSTPPRLNLLISTNGSLTYQPAINHHWFLYKKATFVLVNPVTNHSLESVHICRGEDKAAPYHLAGDGIHTPLTVLELLDNGDWMW